MNNTSGTAVLIGAETAKKRWVKFEIAESVDRGNGLIGIRIHRIKNFLGLTSAPGQDPFLLGWTKGGQPLDLSPVPVYDWVIDHGYNKLGTWVSNAYVAK
jgi:hypothetical protein